MNIGALWIRFPKELCRSGREMLRLLHRHRKVLISVTRVELAKRYSGSALGKIWVVLYPILLLLIYLFVFMVIFKIRLPGFSEFEYVMYIFCGLVPFICVSEAITSGCLSIRQNMHLVKNVMLPIELLPIRSVLVSSATQLVGLGMVLVLLLMNGMLSWKILWLPGVMVLQILFLIGIVLILAGMAVALPDIGHFVNLAVMFIMFISPIGFKPDMVPSHLQFMVSLNPMYYMTDAYRASLIASYSVAAFNVAVFAVIALTSFGAGCAFFRRFKGVLVDYE